MARTYSIKIFTFVGFCCGAEHLIIAFKLTYLEVQQHSHSNHNSNRQTQTEYAKAQTDQAKLHGSQIELIRINVPASKETT